MVAGVILVEACVHLDRHLNLSTKLGYAAQPALTVINDTPPAPGRRLFYPKDRVIGMYDGNGNEDWENGKYGNAPAGNKVGIIVHIIGIVYMLIGLNTVCDIYFCGALDEMVEKWQIKPDVAGATFMAAGGSAPELFTSLIGAVGVESDVGFGTIVGSAVFNVLAVIGCCGMAAQEPIKLTWWPLFRDCTFYIIGLCVLAVFAYGEAITGPDCKKIGGGEIKLFEAIILFGMYLCYICIMVFNEKLEGFFTRILCGKNSQVTPAVDDAAPVENKETDGLKAAGAGEAAPGPPEHQAGASGEAPADGAEPVKPVAAVASDASAIAPAATGAKEEHKHDHVSDKYLRRVEHKCHKVHHHEDPLNHGRHSHKAAAGASATPAATKIEGATVNVAEAPAAAAAPADGAAAVAAPEGDKAAAAPEAGAAAAATPGAEAPKDADETGSTGSQDSEDDIESLMIVPEGTSDKISFFLCCPIYAMLYYGIPRPTPKMFLATFCVALIFIAGFSYWLVYFVEIFGQAILGGGNNVTVVMSFTLLAAGTSIPDLVSSMAVARAGEGDMAVSSSIGSNIFDILVGLPLPWMLKIGIVEGAINGVSDYGVRIKSPYIALYVALLLFMVACVILSILGNKWFLNKPLGAMMSVLYFIFLCIVLPVELIDPINSGDMGTPPLCVER